MRLNLIATIVSLLLLLFAGTVIAQPDTLIPPPPPPTQPVEAPAPPDTPEEPEEVEVVEREIIYIKADSNGIDTIYRSAQTDTTRIKIGKMRITVETDDDPKSEVKEKEVSSRGELTYWTGVDIGINGYLNADYGFELNETSEFLEVDYGRSRVVSLNFLQYRARLISDYVGITTGLGLTYYNFHMRNNNFVSFGNDSTNVLEPVSTENLGVIKNKLRATYLSAPLMLEFNTSRNKSRSFHISAGVIGRLNIGEMYKTRYTEAGDKVRNKQKNDLGFNDFQLDATVRVGYGWFTLFGTLGTQPLFDTDRADEMYAWTAGIALRITD